MVTPAYRYLRVSKADRHRETSLFIDAQRTAVTEHAERKVDTNVRWFVDDGATGANTDRPRLPGDARRARPAA